MLLCLYFLLLAACFSISYTADPEQITVQTGMKATLPCPHKKGDVKWSWYKGGNGKVPLVTIENGKVNIIDKHFAFGSDNSLVIENVTPDLERMYLCNNYRIYLEVMKDLNMVDPEAGYKPVTQRNKGQGVDSGQEGTAAEPENHQPFDFWKVPVGVVVGAALVLLGIITLRHFSNNREERNPNEDEAVPERIYEEIKDSEHQPGRESYGSPYYWTSINETATTQPNNNKYNSVNRPAAEGGSREECVYHLTQLPLQTGNVSE
ncbi:uncharacterized protein LOC117481790 [Trematomus bernacchii]|uniref:uncharacterized protein LOC117481790 n=1 Tax=Trematomus bernacchii TaxID=40690 RepID=UPI001469AF5D|nr:uncharacterized protein LOC117481790 [Trematomus bernacchii]